MGGHMEVISNVSEVINTLILCTAASECQEAITAEVLLWCFPVFGTGCLVLST